MIHRPDKVVYSQVCEHICTGVIYFPFLPIMRDFPYVVVMLWTYIQ